MFGVINSHRIFWSPIDSNEMGDLGISFRLVPSVAKNVEVLIQTNTLKRISPLPVFVQGCVRFVILVVESEFHRV